MELKDGSGYALARKQADALKAKNKPKIEPKLTEKNPIEEKGLIEEKEYRRKRNGLFNEKKGSLASIDSLISENLFKPIRVIDNREYIVNDTLVLPDRITSLVDNKMYLPRHQKLAREYGAKYLDKLAELAKTKAKPSRWYATCTSKKNWQQTHEMLIKLFKRIDEAIGLLKSVGVNKKQYLYYYINRLNKLSQSKIQFAIEMANNRKARDPDKLFTTLIEKGLELQKQEKEKQIKELNAFNVLLESMPF